MGAAGKAWSLRGPCRARFFSRPAILQAVLVMPRNMPHHARRRGFTLVEAMVSISITALAGSLILLAAETSMQTTNESVEQTIALGLARQLCDEISGQRYHGSGESPNLTPLAPTSWEASGTGRERFGDLADYNGYQAQPPKDLWGQPIGQENDAGDARHANFQTPVGYFAKWRQRVEVYYVSDQDFTVRLSAGQTSNYRAVEVFIEYVDTDGSVRTLAQTKRVFSYVPTLP